ncbi:MAG: hypothetical protein IAF02_13420 [Anaerolineae bacterium]|nr:hypothetical protein [Anaerolineae bacterium]
MKKWLFGIILAIGLIGVSIVTPTYAAGRETAVTEPFNGTFSGIAYADYKTSAPLTVAVTQDGDDITAHIDIEKGLKVNAGGLCGTVAIPATTISASSTNTAKNPNILTARVPFDLGGGVKVTADITGEISADGEELDIQVKVKTPFICGKTPVVTGELIAQ